MNGIHRSLILALTFFATIGGSLAINGVKEKDSPSYVVLPPVHPEYVPLPPVLPQKEEPKKPEVKPPVQPQPPVQPPFRPG